MWLWLPLFTFAQQTSVPAYDSYLNKIEDGQYITVFSKPGLNWRYCEKEIDPQTKKEHCKDAVGWLDRQSKVRVIGNPVTRPVQDPVTGEIINEEYVEVEFFYARLDGTGDLVTKMDKGYIEKYNISDKQLETFYSESKSPEEPPKPVIPTPKPDCSANAASAQLKEIEKMCRPMADSLDNLGVNKTAEILNDVVGFCATSPSTKFPASIPPGNVYDSLVYSKLKNKKVPPLKNEDKKYITMDDVASVDALARTLYGEMAKCYRYGLEYPLAVAKIIKNRTDAKQYHKTFIQNPHHPNKTTLMKVATTPSQFSMWQRTTKDKNGNTVYNRPLHQGLCPPREYGKPFYLNKAASKFENDIWVNTMRIATEAVLFPKQFAKRTQNVTDYHYTSDLAKYRGTDKLPDGAKFINDMTHVYPSIQGRKVDYDRCIEVWKM